MTFSKNRDRLIAHNVATQFFVIIRHHAGKADLLSNEHFSVDGTLIEAWASMKSFRPKDDKDQDPPASGGRNAEVDFKGHKRKNETHQSTTDPDARLLKKGKGKEAKLCFMGHALMENRNGLVVDSRLTQATGTTEREAALEMVENLSGTKQITLAADRGYDVATFGSDLRKLRATPHVAQRTKGSAIDKRTTRHTGYQTNLKVRRRVEEIFGWMKTAGLLRKTRHRGLDRVESTFTLAAAAYNLVRMHTLIWGLLRKWSQSRRLHRDKSRKAVPVTIKKDRNQRETLIVKEQKIISGGYRPPPG